MGNRCSYVGMWRIYLIVNRFMFSYFKKDNWPVSVFDSFRAGDQTAFRRIFDHHYARLYKSISEFLGDMDDAEDIVVEAFIQLFDNRSKIQSMDHLIRYLYVVARNKAIQHSRERLVRQKAENEMERLSDELHVEPKEYEGVHMGLLERISDTVEHLPPMRKKIFKLRFYSAMDIRYIANELNLKEQTVRNQLNMAVIDLRNKLNKAF
jgi:RNA polymerase sigma factor (sigma-70 family)